MGFLVHMGQDFYISLLNAAMKKLMVDCAAKVGLLRISPFLEFQLLLQLKEKQRMSCLLKGRGNG